MYSQSFTVLGRSKLLSQRLLSQLCIGLCFIFLLSELALGCGSISVMLSWICWSKPLLNRSHFVSRTSHPSLPLSLQSTCALTNSFSPGGIGRHLKKSATFILPSQIHRHHKFIYRWLRSETSATTGCIFLSSVFMSSERMFSLQKDS